ncbi:MAG: carboxymuconolactone decarboxylase family protein [Gammaproteobacteria bacterium]
MAQELLYESEVSFDLQLRNFINRYELFHKARIYAMTQQRISYVNPETITDAEMIAEMERCAKHGTPRPESQAIRAHCPAIFKSFAATWQAAFINGVMDHNIKELCRIYVSRSVKCEYCGNQRSMKSRATGMGEDDYDELLMFEKSDRYNEREKAALAYTDAIVWDQETTDELWERLQRLFSEPELVELGYFIALTMGQQRWLRTLNIDHHQVLAGTDASMAQGMETAEAMAEAKKSDDYWAKEKHAAA